MIHNYKYYGLFAIIISCNIFAIRNPQELENAINSGNVTIIKTTVVRYPELVNSPNLKNNPLAYAVLTGNLDLADYLIKRGWKAGTRINEWNKSIWDYLLTFPNNNDLAEAYYKNPDLHRKMTTILAQKEALDQPMTYYNNFASK